MRMFNENSMPFPNPPEEFSEYLMNAENMRINWDILLTRTNLKL